MALAGTTGTFGVNPANIGYTLGQKLVSRPNSYATPTVVIITSYISEQDSQKSPIATEGWLFETFETAREFLARSRPLVPSCWILGLSLSDLNHLEEQKQIVPERDEVPIIVIARYRDVPTTVQAMKAGLVDCVVTLFRNQVLLIRTRETMERRRLALHREMELSNLGNWYASLAPRERQVMALPVSGLLNKQFGGELGISEIAVKAHRRQVMQKTQANSLPDLGRMAVEFAPTQALSRSMRLN